MPEKTAPSPRAERPAAPPTPQAAEGALGGLPLAFEENQGQFDPQARFAARHGTGTFFFTADTMAAVFTRPVESEEQPADDTASPEDRIQPEPEATESFALKIRFLGSSDGTQVEGEAPLEGKVSYFRGKDPENWVSGAATFSRIVYHDLWPGVDLAYSGSAGRLKAEYRLDHARDASLIRLRYEGQDELRLDDSGRLVIVTPWGDLHEEPPRATQHDRPVEISFGLDAGKGEVRFVLENVNPDAPLIINP